MGLTMRTVSFQGTGLSQSQRRSMEQQQAIARSFVNPILQAQIDQTMQALDKRREEGAKAERVWEVVFEAKGTPCIADYMGYCQPDTDSQQPGNSALHQ